MLRVAGSLLLKRTQTELRRASAPQLGLGPQQKTVQNEYTHLGYWGLGIGDWAMGSEHWALGIDHCDVGASALVLPHPGTTINDPTNTLLSRQFF